MKRTVEKGRGGGYRHLHSNGDKEETPEKIREKQVSGSFLSPVPVCRDVEDGRQRGMFGPSLPFSVDRQRPVHGAGKIAIATVGWHNLAAPACTQILRNGASMSAAGADCRLCQSASGIGFLGSSRQFSSSSCAHRGN